MFSLSGRFSRDRRWQHDHSSLHGMPQRPAVEEASPEILKTLGLAGRMAKVQKKYHDDDLLIAKFCMMNSDQQNQSVSFASVTEKSHSLSCIHEIVLLRAERAVS